MLLPFVVVNDFDFHRALVSPDQAGPPLVVYPNAVLSYPILKISLSARPAKSRVRRERPSER